MNNNTHHYKEKSLMPTQHSCDVTLYRGNAKEYKGIKTAIVKSLISSKVYLSEQGLEGDVCADTKHHGGMERALHQYPCEHYHYWQSLFPQSKSLFHASAMGENISTIDMTERDVFIGDQYQLGDAIIEVSQPRSPCYKLSHFMEVKDFALQVQQTSRCGWLYRVIKPGFINTNAKLDLVSRVNQSLSVYSVADTFFNNPMDKEALKQIIELKALSQHWKNYVQQRLELGKVESWQARLTGVF